MNGAWVGQDGTVKYGITTDEAMAAGHSWHETPPAPAAVPLWSSAPSSVQQPAMPAIIIASGSGRGRFLPTDWKAIWRVFATLLCVAAVSVGAILAAPFIERAVRATPRISCAILGRRFEANPTISSDGIYTYPASEVTKFGWLHGADNPMHLNGRTVVVTGEVNDANIHVNGNVTFQGTLRNVSVVDDGWMITANNVENSSLRARKIVVTGHSVRTKETLTGPR